MMCDACVGEYGYEDIDNDRTRAAAKLLVKFDREHPGGNYLHIVTDDLNIEDGCLRWCMSDEAHAVFGEMPSELEIRMWLSLLDMTEQERIAVLRWDRRETWLAGSEP